MKYVKEDGINKFLIMENSNLTIPKWVKWLLAPIVGAMVYCGIIHSMPGYILIFMLAWFVIYACVASYYLYKNHQTKAIIGLWIVLIVFVGTFIFNAYGVNKLLGIE